MLHMNSLKRHAQQLQLIHLSNLKKNLRNGNDVGDRFIPQASSWGSVKHVMKTVDRPKESTASGTPLGPMRKRYEYK